MAHAVQAEGLVKRFKQNTALAGIDLQVRQGTVLGLLGPNGAGKTTAVRILATLLRPDGGSAKVGGFDVVRQAEKVRRIVGLTGQYAAVDEDLTGRENLILVGRLLDLTRRDARRRADDLLEVFGLADAGERRAKTYSGGMRRRLDLAASMVGEPEVLFLDEPTTGLDPRSRAEVWAMVRGLVEDGVTVLLTTQYLDEADRLADEIVVIDRGRLVASGTAEELKRTTGSQTLEVRPVQPGDAAAIVAILRAEAGAEPTAPPEGGLITVAVAGRGVLPAVVRALDDAAIDVEEIALRLPSLDEVFFAITGHGAEEGAGAAAQTTTGKGAAA